MGVFFYLFWYYVSNFEDFYVLINFQIEKSAKIKKTETRVTKKCDDEERKDVINK
jgi:hypothetical protein